MDTKINKGKFQGEMSSDGWVQMVNAFRRVPAVIRRTVITVHVIMLYRYGPLFFINLNINESL